MNLHFNQVPVQTDYDGEDQIQRTAALKLSASFSLNNEESHSTLSIIIFLFKEGTEKLNY